MTSREVTLVGFLVPARQGAVPGSSAGPTSPDAGDPALVSPAARGVRVVGCLLAGRSPHLPGRHPCPGSRSRRGREAQRAPMAGAVECRAATQAVVTRWRRFGRTSSLSLTQLRFPARDPEISDPDGPIRSVGRWGRLPAYARPDVASVHVDERGWQRVCAALDAVGIGMEVGVSTCGDAVQLKQAGLPRGTVRVLAEVTVTDHAAVTEAVRILKALGPMPVPVPPHGEEAGACPVPSTPSASTSTPGSVSRTPSRARVALGRPPATRSWCATW